MYTYSFVLSVFNPVTPITIPLGDITYQGETLPLLNFEAGTLLRVFYKRDVFFVTEENDGTMATVNDPEQWVIPEGENMVGNTFKGKVMVFNRKSQSFEVYVDNVELRICRVKNT